MIYELRHLCIWRPLREGLCRFGEVWAALGAEKLRYVTADHRPPSKPEMTMLVAAASHASSYSMKHATSCLRMSLTPLTARGR